MYYVCNTYVIHYKRILNLLKAYNCLLTVQDRQHKTKQFASKLQAVYVLNCLLILSKQGIAFNSACFDETIQAYLTVCVFCKLQLQTYKYKGY